ncbi:MAG: hypothetical protein ACYSWU_24855, partial [Planctomycetota bacterium]
NPAAEVDGQKLQWRLGQLAPGESRTLEVDGRATQAGSLTHCADAMASGGLKASDCATATVMAPSVEVKVTGPTQATVGSRVTFEVLITNHSQATATGLMIWDRFDPGLEHEEAEIDEAAERKIKRKLGDLGPGESQRIGVTFRVTQAGRLSHEVEVTGANGVRASAQASLVAVDGAAGEPQPAVDGQPSVTVKKSILDENDQPIEAGAELPSRRVGETVRFVIDVTNNGSQEIRNLTLVDRYDPSLAFVAASDGYREETNALIWTIDSLPTGPATRYAVHCRCTRAAARAYNRATVTTQDGTEAQDDASLEVLAAAEGLTISVADLHDLVRLGKPVTYLIHVSNQGQTSQEEVSVVATVPVGMIPDRLGISGPGKPTVEGQTVRFEPVAELAQGLTVTYRVRVLARQTGQFIFRAEVSSRDQFQPLTAEEDTEVIE